MVKSTKARTVTDFRSAHDTNVIVPNKIKMAFEAMLKEGPEQWDYEGDFVKRADISNTQLGAFREQFLDHIVEAAGMSSGRAGRRVWFADAKIAKKIRGI
jgi:hypothetical protein